MSCICQAMLAKQWYERGKSPIHRYCAFPHTQETEKTKLHGSIFVMSLNYVNNAFFLVLKDHWSCFKTSIANLFISFPFVSLLVYLPFVILFLLFCTKFNIHTDCIVAIRNMCLSNKLNVARRNVCLIKKAQLISQI